MRIEYETELYHHGIRGQKWGVRRFQPYSYTGPRKGGKLGKEIGMAGKKAGKAIASVGRKVGGAAAALGRKAGGAAKAKIAQAKANARVKKVEKMTATKSSFQKNYNKLTQEERDAAMKRFTDMQKISDMKAEDIKRYANYAKSTFDIIHNVKGAADDVSTMLTGKDIGENMKKDSKLKEGTKEWAEYQEKLASAEQKRAMAEKTRAETESKIGNGNMTKAERVQDERNAELLRRKFAKEDAEEARQNSTSEKLRREVVKASDFVDDWRKDATPKLKDAANKAKDYGQKAADKAMDYGQKAADKAKVYGQKAADKAMDYGQKAADKAKVYGQKAAEKASQSANAIKAELNTSTNSSFKKAAASFDPDTYDWKPPGGGGNNKPPQPPKPPSGGNNPPPAASPSLADAVKERQAADKKNQKVYDAVDNFTEELLRKNRKKLGHSHLRGEIVGAHHVKIRYETELYHHGIRGQKWGQRRFQNADGSLTSKGKARYSSPKFKSSESSDSNRTGGGGGGGGGDDELAQLEAELAELTPGSAEYSAKKQEIELLKYHMSQSYYNLPVMDANDHSATGKIKYTADKLKYDEATRRDNLRNAHDNMMYNMPKQVSEAANQLAYKAPIVGDKYRRAKGNQKIDDLGHQFFGDFASGKKSSNHASISEGRKKKVTSGGTSPSRRRKSGASQVGNGMPSTIPKKRPIGRKKKVTSGGMAIRKRRRSGASQVGNGMPSNIRRY